MTARLFYICLAYSIFSRKVEDSCKLGKHSPNFNYTEGCLSL